MEQHNINLTTPEIAALWTTYIQNSAMICCCQHILVHMQDEEIRPLVEEQLYLSNMYMEDIKKIFMEEEFPIPKGFTEKDVDLSAPALFSDVYGLSLIYRFGQMGILNYGTSLTKVGRDDTVQFFDQTLATTVTLYKKSLELMFSKGIYDRPPKIPYPEKVKFISHEPSLLEALFGEKRPMNALELGDIFYTIERNYIGLLLLIGFIQVTRDKEIADYLQKGKRLAEKQIDILNKKLTEEEHIGNIPVSMEVTDSTVSPFSERLILFFINATSSTGIHLLGYALSVSMRSDLTVEYARLVAEIMKYIGDGNDLLIKRGWMEQPPMAVNRSKLYNPE